MVYFTRYDSFREADLRATAEKPNSYLTLAHARVERRRVRGREIGPQVLDAMIESAPLPEWRNWQTQGT